MATSYPSPQHIIAAARAIAQSLDNQQHYAIVGGAACLLLGSSRVTSDVDFVVPKGEIKAARQLLRAQKDHFAVESRTNHTNYLGTPPIEIQIISPAALFREPFDNSTETIEVQGARVLKPTLILNAKCKSILGRAGEDKKTSDAHDIRFLLQWCATNEMHPAALEISNATKDFVELFIVNYGGAELWKNAGYDASIGAWAGS